MTEQQRWDRIWCGLLAAVLAALAAFGVVDADREKRDIAEGRTHMTGTTFSSWIRRQVAKLGRLGPVIFRVGIYAIAGGFLGWFVPHIVDHIDNRKAHWQ